MLLHGSVNLATMTDGDDEDDQDIVLDRVDNAVVADADAVQVMSLADQFDNAGWSWVGGQGADPRNQPRPRLLREVIELPFGRARKLDAIGHGEDLQTVPGLDLFPRHGAVLCNVP